MSKKEKEVDKIRLAILKIPKGKLFSLADFRHLAGQNNIKQVFHRLAKENEIQRVSRGIYMREKIIFSENIHGGCVFVPKGHDIIKKIADLTGEIIFSHGADSLRYLRLSTQVPMVEIYYTSGNTRSINLGHRKIRLFHFNSNLVRSNKIEVQHVFSGLAHLGKKRVDLDTIKHVKEVIGQDSFDLLFHHLSDIPSWLSNILFLARRDGNG
jgi:hypothetical protein